MRTVLRGLTAAGVVSAVVLAGAAAHAHDDHRGHGLFDKGNQRFLADRNHLPPTTKNVELVSKLQLSDIRRGRVSDVGVHGKYAYLGDFAPENCSSRGVWIVDISDPQKPREVKYLNTGAGSYVGEGVQAVGLKTAGYTGDVMVISAEPCTENGSGGATLIDVSNPEMATPILSTFGDFDPIEPGKRVKTAKPGDVLRPPTAAPKIKADVAHPSHSVFLWSAGAKAYAVLVDNDEGADIFDITDPRKPVKIGEYDLPKMFPQILQKPDSLSAGIADLFFHDVIVKQIAGRQIMLVSNWNAGYVKLDVTDPRKPKYVADSDYARIDPELFKQRGDERKPEGSAHQAEFTADNKYMVAADEDFAPGQATVTFDGKTKRTSTLGRPLGSGKVQATPVYAGDACPGHPVPSAPKDGKPYIALVEDGTCDTQVKHDAVRAAGGYRAIAYAGAYPCVESDYTLKNDALPIFLLDRVFAFNPFGYDVSKETPPNCAAGEGTKYANLKPGTKGKPITVEGFFDGWGYVHLFANRDGKLKDLDTWAIPEAMDPANASGAGALSVHEAATSPTRADLVYFAYYGGGFRVASVTGGKIREVGAFIDDRGNDLWGVQVFEHNGQEFVAASDRSYGLYIFKYTG